MRNAGDSGNFPYVCPTTCIIEVDNNGKVSQIDHESKSDLVGVKAAYKRAVNKETKMYAVWPGKWASDIFLIDNLDAFAKAFGFDPDENSTYIF